MAIITSSSTKPASRSFGTGIFIDTVTIVAVEILTCDNLPKYLLRTPDIGIRVIYHMGKAWTPSLEIFGDYKMTPTGVTWGSAFKVRDFFERLGVSMQDFDTERGITEDMLDAVKGKQFKRLSYVKAVRPEDPAKYYYADWTEIAGPEESAESLAARFHRSLRKGYPTNYHPEVVRLGEMVPVGAALPDTARASLQASEEDAF